MHLRYLRPCRWIVEQQTKPPRRCRCLHRNDQCSEGICSAEKASTRATLAPWASVWKGNVGRATHDGQVLIEMISTPSACRDSTQLTQEQSHPRGRGPLKVTQRKRSQRDGGRWPHNLEDDPVVVLESPAFKVPQARRFSSSFHAVGDESCVEDTLSIKIGSDTLSVACESTDEWVDIALTLSLTGASVNPTFEASLAAETASAVDIASTTSRSSPTIHAAQKTSAWKASAWWARA